MKQRYLLFTLSSLALLIIAIIGVAFGETTGPVTPTTCISLTDGSEYPPNSSGCVIARSTKCPADAPNVYYNGDGGGSTVCYPDNAREITDAGKCQTFDGIIYYTNSDCQKYRKSQADALNQDTFVKCMKGKELTAAGICETKTSSSPTPSSYSSPSADASCTMDVWMCGSWSTCSTEGTQTRTCSLTYDCKNTNQPSKPTESRSCTPSPSPSPSPSPTPAKSKCAKKPDTAKGNAEPTALPEGTEREEDSPYSLWICYSQPETTDSCTAQATKRLGNTASPCIYGQESISCPQKNTVAYRDGDNLKCATIKKVEVIKETEIIRETITPPPTVITETVRETIEVPSPISITLPETLTEESCQEYKTAIDEQVIDQGNAFIEAADKLSKSAATQNPEFKKLFYATLKESAKKSRKLEKLVNTAACNKNTLNEVQAAAKDFKTEHLEKVNQGIVFIDKDVKVQNRYVGIRDNIKWLEKFIKSVKGDTRKEKLYGDDLKAFEEVRTEFDELLRADTEEKVFGFEIEDMQERMEKIREEIEKDATLEESDKKATLKKGSSSSKKILKQSSKSKKKSDKKSSKKKKKSSKKKKK